MKNWSNLRPSCLRSPWSADSRSHCWGTQVVTSLGHIEHTSQRSIWHAANVFGDTCRRIRRKRMGDRERPPCYVCMHVRVHICTRAYIQRTWMRDDQRKGYVYSRTWNITASVAITPFNTTRASPRAAKSRRKRQYVLRIDRDQCPKKHDIREDMRPFSARSCCLSRWIVIRNYAHRLRCRRAPSRDAILFVR